MLSTSANILRTFLPVEIPADRLTSPRYNQISTIFVTIITKVSCFVYNTLMSCMHKPIAGTYTISYYQIVFHYKK